MEPVDIWHPKHLTEVSKQLPERPLSSEIIQRPRRVGGLGPLVREMTNDGIDLVAYALAVFSGEITDAKWGRADAMQWLADRGFGKSTQEVVLDASVSVDVLIKAAIEARKAG